ncbi:CopG family transcriptional regulator [Azospirillum rugosum]|uniref:Uncharacterized protein n=1 Tax=Azospirillum rugosum TaxID=416170 RepID=A0ABS4SIX3_9PROT|nr:CopG family transcriptional regulator [Azospirillum rugosum]MBP2292517.1 hypothetical protein [Azospirillum rugosum]MDQ0526459.1 hypothetical protein [Azospirillum rugosum]
MTKPQPCAPEETPDRKPRNWDPVYGDVEAYHRAVQEALESAKAGLLVDDEEVWAWVDSWGTEHELPMPEPKVRPQSR